MYGHNYAVAGSGNAEDGCRWTSEPSYVSTSTSSTNSRAPCLARQAVRDEVVTAQEELRLSSVIPLLVLCYAVNHLPVLVSEIVTFPKRNLTSFLPRAVFLFGHCILSVVLYSDGLS
jgi:hypothetical protein